MKPVIGITTSYSENEQRLDPRYLEAIVLAGGTPIMVPMLENPSDIQQVINMIDGLLIPGGPAIVHGMTGNLPDDIDAPHEKRVDNDSWYLEGAIKKKIPVMGVCYGMQFVNAHFGGSIYADVEVQQALHSTHSEKRGGGPHAFHSVEGSKIQSLLGDRPIQVNSRHIQAIESLGSGLRATGYAPDEVIESIESDNGLFLGVQFHPERMALVMSPLFKNLVRTAGESL